MLNEDDDEAEAPTLRLLPLSHAVEATSRRPFGDREPGEGESSTTTEDDHPIPTAADPAVLPLSLRFLFVCNGITLALPSTALLYVVNTRVAVPLSLLPAYGSIAFLPFALKPLYAVLNQIIIITTTATATTEPMRRRQDPLCCNRSVVSRDALLGGLLLAHSATLVATYYGARSVETCFVWAFLRGLTSAWAEFLLGIAIVSRVDVDLRRNNETAPNDLGGPVTAASAGAADSSCRTTSAFLTSRYQADAASARNVGSLLSFGVSAAYFFGGWWGDKGSSRRAIDESSARTLLFAAGWVNVAAASVALLVGTTTGGSLAENRVVRCCPATLRFWSNIRDHSSHRHMGGGSGSCSYRALGDVELDREEPRILSTFSSPRTATLEPDQVPSVDLPIEENDTAWRAVSADDGSVAIHGIVLVSSLQLSLVLLALQQPIAGSTSPAAWWCLWTPCLTALILSGIYAVNRAMLGPSTSPSSSPNRSTGRRDKAVTYRVGLFLILKHAVPNCTYLMESYLYTSLQEHPGVLQILSIYDSAMTTLAAWLYGRYGTTACVHHARSPSNQYPHPVYLIILLTTTAASLLSLSNLSLLYCLTPATVHSVIVPQLVVILIVRSVTTLADEWKFLPDVILATLASMDDPLLLQGPVGVETAARAVPPVQSSNHEGDIGVVLSRSADTPPLSRDLRYGSLISCIDFGEQLAALLTFPLISILHVTRDEAGGRGSWNHLDRLIVVTAMLSLFSIALLPILPGASLSAMQSIVRP
jgi:hypothetical protein